MQTSVLRELNNPEKKKLRFDNCGRRTGRTCPKSPGVIDKGSYPVHVGRQVMLSAKWGPVRISHARTSAPKYFVLRVRLIVKREAVRPFRHPDTLTRVLLQRDEPKRI